MESKLSTKTNKVDSKTGAERIKWDLSDLFSGISDKKLLKILDSVENDAQKFAKKYRGKLNSLSAAKLANAYSELEELISPLYKAAQFIHLEYAIDTSDSKIKQMVSRVDEVESNVGNALVFFDLEISEFSNTHFNSIKKESKLAPYVYEIEHQIKTAQYNLTEPEEKLGTLKNLTGSSAWKKLYSELTSSFEFEFKLDGKVQKMNGSQLRALRQHPNKKVRRDAMTLFYSRYEEHQLILGHIYYNIVKSYSIEKDLRGYKSAISIKNIHNDLPDPVIKTLHKVTSDSNTLVQRYYKLKKKILKLPDLTLADIYAPMPQSDRKYSYKEAKDLVLDGFSAFDNEFYTIAKKMFDDKRIHAPVQPKKRGGAFCSGSTPDVYPYVMLNFLGQPRDVSTIAHELGHAIHDVLASKQTLFSYHPILPLAETASVFAEMIITDKLLKTESSKKAKIALLTDKLEDIFATSHRQNMFSNFEIECHKRMAQEQIDANELCNMYYTQLKTMFGSSVKITDEYKWEWSTIPHIHESPFYVYAYNFGNLLVFALYQQYLKQGEAFIPKLKTLLASGSSKSPIQICKDAGIDITKETFWQQSIDYIESLIKELESLLK